MSCPTKWGGWRMHKSILAVLAVALGTTLAVAGSAGAAAAKLPAYVTAGLAGPGRAGADKAQDAARKPGEMVVFAGIKPGMNVAEFVPGARSVTRVYGT